MSGATLLAVGLGAITALNTWILPRTFARPRAQQPPRFAPAAPAIAAAPAPIAAAPAPLPPEPEPLPPRSVVVLFEIDGDDLDEAALAALERLGEPVTGARLLIEGHADQTGPERHNLLLSWRRARAVARRLEERGWPAEELEVKAHGSERPAGPGRRADDLRRNRRVEIALGSASP